MLCSFKPDIFGSSRFDHLRLGRHRIPPKPGKRAILKSGTRFDFIQPGSNNVLIK
jgi:hypothetical protein